MKNFFILLLLLCNAALAQTTLPSTSFTGAGGTATIQGTLTPPVKTVQGSAAPAITMQANTYVVPNAASVIKTRLGATQILVRPAGDFGNYQAIINGCSPSCDTDYSEEDENIPKAGSFRLNCRFSHMLAVDPIVYPGVDGISHWHQFFDNASVNAYINASDLVDSGGTGSCDGGIANISGYWTPVVVDMTTGFIVQPEANEVYYKEALSYGQLCGPPDCVLTTARRTSIQELPRGLVMIGGNPGNTTGNSGDGALSGADPNYYYPKYECTPPEGAQQSFLGNFPGAECPNGSEIIALIYFPNCWDGVNLDSPDHRSHMAFAQEATAGCPPSHPVPVPWVSFNLHYKPTPTSRPENWRFSSDNYALTLPGGGSVHGDWAFGWRPEFMTLMVKNCIRKNVDCHTDLLGNHATLSQSGLDGVGQVNPLWIQRTVGRDGDTITAPTPSNVRWGNPGQWVYKPIYTFGSTFTCNSAFFGTDPTPGVSKICQTDDPMIDLMQPTSAIPLTARVMMVGDSISLAVAPALKAAMTASGHTHSELIGNAQVTARSLSDPLVNTSAFSSYQAQYVNTASGGTVTTWPGLHGDFADIRAMMDGTCPDILVLALGAYDVGAPNTTNELAAFTKIVAQARIQNNEVRIFVVNLIPSTGTGQAAWESALNATLAGWATSTTNPISSVTVIDQNTGFNASTMLAGDGVTPNSAGVTQMVSKYMTALGAYLH